MNKSRFDTLFQKEMTRKEFLAYGVFAAASVFGIVGLLKQLQGQAATPTAALEPEAGTKVAPVATVADPTASGGSAVQFTAPSPPADTFTLGVTKPDASNVGYAAGTVLTTVATDQIFATNGQVIENKRFTAKVTVRGKNITFRNCWFNGSNAQSFLVYAGDLNVENLLIERCTFHPSSYARTLDGMRGHNFTLLRCDLSGTTDTVGIFRATTGGALNVKLHGNWMHGLGFWSPDPGHPSPNDNKTHNDLIQIHHGGDGIHVFGNRLDGFIDKSIGQGNSPSVDTTDANGNPVHVSGNSLYPSDVCMSVVMASPASTAAGLRDFIFDKNWVDGGVVMINWPRADGVNVQITNNRWGRKTYYGDSYTILAKEAQPMTVTGNTYEDNGQSFNGRKKG